MLVVLAFWGRKWPCLWRGKVTDKPAAVFLDRKCWTLSWCYFLSSRFLCERKQKPHKPRGMSWLATLCEIQWNHKDAGPDLECNCCTELWGGRKKKSFARQSCWSTSSLEASRYLYLLVDASQHKVPTISNISLLPFLVVLAPSCSFVLWREQMQSQGFS